MWNEICANILVDFTSKLEKEKIEYFILRNHKDLPLVNHAKDIDIVINPKKIKEALKILKTIYKRNGIEYYDEFRTGNMICTHGMSIINNIGIHIDLLGGLNIKGYYIECFDELYSRTEKYNDLNILDEKSEIFFLFLTKIFGNKKTKIKEKYKNIFNESLFNKAHFLDYLSKYVSDKSVTRVNMLLANKEYDEIYSLAKVFNRDIKKKSWRRFPLKTFRTRIKFIVEKIYRIIFCYRHFSRTAAVIAPDGTGKSTFIERLIEMINYYYVSDDKVRLYHFRPELIPNLRDVGQNMGVMGEKKVTTDPHYYKTVNRVSSFFRIMYYTFDYIVGWRKYIRRDVHFDKYSIFDRYSYDLMVDPYRTRLKLSKITRKIFVSITPKPKVVFFLKADAERIRERKQELGVDEIERQLEEYSKLSKKRNVITLDANSSVDEMCLEAIKILFEKN